MKKKFNELKNAVGDERDISANLMGYEVCSTSENEMYCSTCKKMVIPEKNKVIVYSEVVILHICPFCGKDIDIVVDYDYSKEEVKKK